MPILIMIFMTLLSCSHVKKSNLGKSSKDLFQQALDYKKRGQLDQALAVLKDLKNQFLYDSYNKDAALLTADIYFEQENYPKAVEHYENFKKIYPQIKTYYVLYKLGLAFFHQLPSSADRDLSQGEKATKHFTRLLKKKNPYKKQAQEFLKKIQMKQAEKELEQIRFYLKKSWEDAAFKKLKFFISTYSKSPLLPQALLLSYNLAKKVSQPAEPFKTRLLKDFPKSPEAQSL